MKKIENNFIVTGYVGKDAEIRQFTTASVARFSIAVSRQEKSGDDSNNIHNGRVAVYEPNCSCDSGC